MLKKISKVTAIVGDFNIPLLVFDISPGLKMNKDLGSLNNRTE